MAITRYTIDTKYVGLPGHHSFHNVINESEDDNGNWVKLEDCIAEKDNSYQEGYNQGYKDAMEYAHIKEGINNH